MAIAAAALVMVSAATMVHMASGGGGGGGGGNSGWSAGYDAWTSIVPDAFQFDRRGAAPPASHALPEAAATPPGGGYAAQYAVGGSGGGSGGAGGGGSSGSGGRGTWGSSLRDGAYAVDRGSGGYAGAAPRGLALVPDVYAASSSGDGHGGLAAAPVLRHDRWALGEGLAPGDAYAYLVCGVPATPMPSCFEATLAVVRQDAGAPVEGSVYSPAASPIPWHVRVTISDLIGFYARDGPVLRASDYRATGAYDDDMHALRKAALFDVQPPPPWSFDLRFAGVRYEPRPVPPNPDAVRYAGALEDTVFLLGSKIGIEMGPYNDRLPVLEDGEHWPNSVGAAVHVRESVAGYSHDYLYGPVEVRGGEPGSGHAMHRVTYTGDDVPMADLVVADGFPFPLSGDVRDTVLPRHFAADPHVDSRWWFRLVAVSSESMRALDSGGMGGEGVGGDGGATAGASTSTAAAATPSQPPLPPPPPSPYSASMSATGADASAGSNASGSGSGADTAAEEPPAAAMPPINIPRISGLLNNPAGLYAYLAELAAELAVTGGAGSTGTGTGTMPSPAADRSALTVTTDRASYERGQTVRISGVSSAEAKRGGGDGGGGGGGIAPKASPFVLISITGPGGASAASLLAPVSAAPGAAGGPAGNFAPYAASVDTSAWSGTHVPAGNMTVIAVRGADTATASFVLRDDVDDGGGGGGGGGNTSAAQHRPSAPVPSPAGAGGNDGDSGTSGTTPRTPRFAPLTVAAGDVAYRHGDTAILSGTAAPDAAGNPLVLLSIAGPDGAALASLTASVGSDGRYTRNVTTGDWPSGPAGYGTVAVVAVRGADTASTSFELLPPSSASAVEPPAIPASAFPSVPGLAFGGGGGNGTGSSGIGFSPASPADPDPDIGSAGIRGHVRYMIDGNRTVGDLVVYDHSIVVYLGATSSAAADQPPAQPTLWLRIPRTVMDPPDLDGDGRVFDVRIDGAISTSHRETSDATHRTLSIPVLRTTGVVEVSGLLAAAGPDIDGGGADGGGAPAPAPAPAPPPPSSAPAPPQCTGEARCLRGTITSVPTADAILLSGGMSVRLALVSVPAPLEAGGEQARRLVASICPAGTQIVVDEDDLGASATSSSTTFRGRIVGEAFCNDGAVSIQDVLVASGLGVIDRASCDASEFAARAWAAGACGTDAEDEDEGWDEAGEEEEGRQPR